MTGDVKWNKYIVFFAWLIVAVWIPSNSLGLTDPRDVSAINDLYIALGEPPLPRWMSLGGDPCVDAWQGVQCVNSNITGLVLSGLNLGGELGESLQKFSSIIQIDFRNNHIGGSIPSNFPITVRTLFLSGNQLSGNIPSSVSSLGQLADLSLNRNLLTGEIPDSFQQLKGLTNMDLSFNNLTGQLPLSLANLTSLTTLNLRNNQLTGKLDALQDLPLFDLNVENNLFAGPIPPKLLNVPFFRREGNPFNITIMPSPPSLPSPSGAPTPKAVPTPNAVPNPNADPTKGPKPGVNLLSSKRVMWLVIGGILALVVLSLGFCRLFRFIKQRQMADKLGKMRDSSVFSDYGQSPKQNRYLRMTSNSMKKEEKDNHSSIDLSSIDDDYITRPPPPPPPALLRVNQKPVLSRTTSKVTAKTLDSTKTFTIASLQQYTDSFSQENLLGQGLISSVYRAQLSTLELLAVKKLDTRICRPLSDGGFIELVSVASKIQNENVAELVGYCMEHEQRLLVYKYYQNGTLHEALHSDEFIDTNLSWNTRIRLALGAARALEYLHEVCEPPIVHGNFKSSNILLDDHLAVRVSDCGLTTVFPDESLRQLMNEGYGAPEVELGASNCKGDVYSFGIIMLELLTGRKSCDRSRPRGEQFLVRWAIPQLHDIDALSKMVDPSLNGVYPTKSLSRFADIISLCIQPEPEFRPPMSEIVENLLHMV